MAIGVGNPIDQQQQLVTHVPQSISVPPDKKGYGVKQPRSFSIDLTSARNAEPVEIEGTLLNFVKAVSGGALTVDAQVDVAFNESSQDDIPFIPGFGVSGVPFDKVYITNAAQSGVTAYFLYASDEPEDRVNVNA